MHVSPQPGGHSPKSMMCTSQSKSVSENSQNTAVSFPSKIKGKKRERRDNGSDSVKRERSSKIDDCDSGLCKPESILKSEIAKITQRGGLVDFEGVEKLVQLMQPYKMEKKMDLVCRSVLAEVVAATDKFECLNQFVIRGLPVMDEWLQDVHKGRIVEANLKDGDKHVEEFLHVLLRALDKLPVNLQALQMCNIGRSVNHLRLHKNMDIQKKARGLVDTWKRRVKAEVGFVDSGSGTMQAKGSLAQFAASKTASIKQAHGEVTNISASSSLRPTSSTSAPVPGKDNQAKGSVCGTPDSLLMREDKSSSFSQSHNQSQSCSVKEDARSSTAGSMSSYMMSSVSSRLCKSSSGFMGASVSRGQKDCTGRNISQPWSPTADKFSRSVQLVEKVDVPVQGRNHELMVKMPNQGRSPAKSANGGSYEDPNNMSRRASSPVVSGKHDRFDRNVKEKSDADRSNDFKDIVTRSDEAEGVKYNERSVSTSNGDAVGMNLLASVAAGEISKSDMFSPSASSQRNSSLEETYVVDDAKSKPPVADNSKQDRIDQKPTESIKETDVKDSEMKEKPGEKEKAASSPTGRGDNINDGHSNKRFHKANTVSSDPNIKSGETDSSMIEVKVSNLAVSVDNPKKSSELPLSNLLYEGDGAELKPSPTALDSSRDLDADKVVGDLADQCKRRSDEKVDGVSVTDHKRECNEGIVETKEIPVCHSSGSQNETVEKNMKPTESRLPDPTSDKTNSSVSAVVPETASKMEFDLNEGFASDDGKQGEPIASTTPGFSAPGHVVSPLTFPYSSVTVSTAAKGPFVPPEELLRFKGEIGWKGSATTSAFRPAEPRKSISTSDTSTSRRVLDFDLNVPDEGVLEEIRESTLDISFLSNHTGKKAPKMEASGFDLDLNRADESNNMGPSSSSSHSLRTVEVRRGFDLNNGPGADDVSTEQSQYLFQHSNLGSLQSQPAMYSIRMNSPETGSFSSLFPPGNSYPVIPPGMPRMFGPDVNRGPVLSSPATCQFPMFPFGPTFPMPDSSYGGRILAPGVNPQLLSQQISRPYYNTGMENNRRWSRHGLDLNAGPGSTDVEGKEEPVALTARQHSVSSSQAVANDPDRGSSSDSFRYKQPSWK